MKDKGSVQYPLQAVNPFTRGRWRQGAAQGMKDIVLYSNWHAGYVHDLVALRAVRAGCLVLQGVETLEHSWFPGYAWTIACCSACGSHLVRLRLAGSVACF